MSEIDDHDLLASYAREKSEPAFAMLVERHVNLVYSVALRSVGNAHAAQEITQAVFIILAQKAGRISGKTILSGWLCQTARLTAANFLRGEIRRQKREQEAYMQSTLNQLDTEAWTQIAPLLDEALGRLGERDRNAIVLRFFENKSLREVGVAMGAGEDAAKMRVTRALEKLRKIFTKCGVTLSAAAIAGAVAANSVQAAPAGLANTISAVAAAKGAAAATSTLTLVKGALKIMAWTKAKTAIVVAAGALLAAGTTTITVKEIQSHRTYPWQVQNVSSDILRKTPPQVRIVPSNFRFTTAGAAGGTAWIYDEGPDAAKVLGISQPAQDVVLSAYGQELERTVFVDQAPPGKFDFIANLPSGNKKALQNEIRRRFGLVGRRENKETNVLALKVRNPGAPGLQPNDPRRLQHHALSSSESGPGYFSSRNQDLPNLARFLESHLKIPVVDQTGLAGRYDIDLKWDEPDYQQPDVNRLKQGLLNQLGLELVSTNMPIEMLVVEKAK